MKKLLNVLLLLGIMSTAWTQNENPEQGNRLPGQIVLNNGEIKEGYIQRLSKIKSQKKVYFYANVNDKKAVEYKPDALKSYQVADAYYQSLPYEGFTQKTKVFVERSLAGKLSIFTYYLYTKDVAPKEYTVTSGGQTTVIKDFDGESLTGEMIMYKENGEQLNLSSVKLIMGFKSVMSKYVAECAPLSQKIANKESGYGVLNVIKIAEEFNNCK